MGKSQEIWFFERSPVARALRSIGKRYILRAVPAPKLPHRSARSNHGASLPGVRGPACPVGPPGPAVWLADPAVDNISTVLEMARQRADLRLIALTSAPRCARLTGQEWFAALLRNTPVAAVLRTIDSAFTAIELAARERAAREELARADSEREELNRIGVALSSTHDVSALLDMILAKTREITGADAGSLYLVETERSENGAATAGAAPQRRLRFKVAQNDSKNFPFFEYSLPIAENSLAGYAALHGQVVVLEDAYRLPKGRPYRFNTHYDNEAGYRTRSLLTVPMKDARGEVIGVVQLLNCKRHREARLLTPKDLDREVQPFPARAVRLAESLASQAAVAYENSRLYGDIEKLFEGFVQASVMAIEQRDPTTSGHSLRVSQMTVGLAQAVDRCATGAHRQVHFSRDQLKEIRYAGLLHDFGKLGVHEEVLLKAKKLYPSQFDVLNARFDYMRKELELRYERRKFCVQLGIARGDATCTWAALDEELRAKLAELDQVIAAIAAANEPSVLEEGEFAQLSAIAGRTYRDPNGIERPLLTPEEVRFLSIPQGTLDSFERQQIEAHVVHSFNFLMQIPWTREIRGIPEIARAHHEKLNGTGYPYRLQGAEIPIQARMMTICDIFDALSAADRPYKKAVPAEHALTILENAVARQELDAGLFQIFLDAHIYEPARHA